jgi:hypothetical protein
MLRRFSNRTNGTRGSAHSAQLRARETVTRAIDGLTGGNLEHVPTPCVVHLAPSRRLPRNEERVTNEGGLIRFGLGASNDREVRAK